MEPWPGTCAAIFFCVRSTFTLLGASLDVFVEGVLAVANHTSDTNPPRANTLRAPRLKSARGYAQPFGCAVWGHKCRFGFCLVHLHRPAVLWHLSPDNVVRCS